VETTWDEDETIGAAELVVVGGCGVDVVLTVPPFLASKRYAPTPITAASIKTMIASMPVARARVSRRIMCFLLT